MSVLITGTSTGIGRATALRFIAAGYRVIGVDRNPSTIEMSDIKEGNPFDYTHIVWDVTDYDNMPDFSAYDIEYLINNAGTQNEDDIETNLRAVIKLTEAVAFQPMIKSIVNVASTSAHNGAEFPEYAASKGGLLSYTKNVASRVARYGATCNSISPGGVKTDMNKHILESPELQAEVLNETMLYRWADAEEIAEWIFFIAVVNQSMTAQDIIIDNGELSTFNFVW